MILIQKTFQTLATILFIFIANKNIAQCLQPAWDITQTYYKDDIVNYNGDDWILGWDGNGSFVPGSRSGVYEWNSTGTCASISPPTLESTQVRGTYCTTSFGIGNIISDNGATITARGFVFGLTTNPNLNDDAVLLDAGTGTGDEFEGLLDNLTPETTYYIKTYATNSKGTSYGTETSFTTRATADCEPNCVLACDMTDAGLLDPSESTWANPSFSTSEDDTICVTQDVEITATIILDGMLKVCNGAKITLTGGINIRRGYSGSSFKGQIVYEGCGEIFDGVGSYVGETTNGSDHDPTQMISYCGTCVNDDESQFLQLQTDPAEWAATCRPTSTLLTPLPVELTKFTVQKDKNGGLLNWTTNSEINNSHFEIEFSYDGVNWSTIGIVQGAGNSFEINTYQFTHNEIGSGVHYYRLKQIDFDGTKSYSNVKHLSFDNKSKPKSFIAFQNQNNKVEVQALFNGMGEAFLIDTRGKIVEQMTFISTNKSGLNLEFNSINLTKGIYFVKIKSDNALLGEKVQILK